MSDRLKKFIIGVLAGAVFVMLVFNASVMAQEDLEKKYAPILGEYEFDMADYGMGVVTVEFYVEDDTLWSWPDIASSPASLEPVEGAEFEFIIEDPDEGTYELVFVIDESGDYSKCQVRNVTMGIDVVGEKIKE